MKAVTAGPMPRQTSQTPDDKSVRRCARMWQLPLRHARVAACLLLAMSDKEISAVTGLTLATVRTYVKAIYKAAEVHSRVALMRASIAPRRHAP